MSVCRSANAPFLIFISIFLFLYFFGALPFTIVLVRHPPERKTTIVTKLNGSPLLASMGASN